MKKILTITFFSIFIISQSVAQTTITWNGDGVTDFSWNDANNWDLDRIPEAGDDVVIPAGSGNPTFGVVLDVDATVSSITIQSTAASPPMFPLSGTPAVPTVFNVGFNGFFTTTLTVTNDVSFTGGEVTTTIPASSGIIAGGNLSGDFDDLFIAASGLLTIDGNIAPTGGQITNDGTISVGGTLPSTGIILNTPSTVNYSGSTDQTVTSLTYDQLIFSNSGTKTIGGTVLYSTLTFASAQNVVFDTDSPFIILIPDAGTYNTLTFKGDGAKSINSDLTVTSLIIDPTDKPAVIYSSDSPQTIIDAEYENLTFSDDGLKIIPVTPTVNGTFSAGAVDVRYSGDFDGSGVGSSDDIQKILPGTYNKLDLVGTDNKIIDTLDVVVNSDFTANSSTIVITNGELNLNGVSDFGTSSIEFGRDGDQDVPRYPSPYFDLIVSGTGVKSLIDASSIEAVRDFIIRTGGTFDLADDSITICRNITVDGTLNQTAGTIILGCDNPTTISGASTISVTNLTLIKTANVDVTISTDVEIVPEGVVTLSSGDDDIIIGTGGSLTLNADGSNSYATVAALPKDASITGDVTAEAYFNATQRSWWHVSTPVSNPPAQDWINSGIPITGNFSGNSNDDIVGTDFQSMYSFDETSSETQNDSWVDFPDNAVTETMELARGYRIFIRDDATTFSPETAALTGSLNQGDITIPLTFTDNGSTDNDGWNLIGNPYPAALNWSSVDKTGLALSDAYVWNANTKTYAIATSIAPFQAFFVKASATESDLSVEESFKTTSVPLTRRAPESNVINVSIQETDLDRPFNSASTKIAINPLATANVDFDFDQGHLSRNMFNQLDDPTLVDIKTISEDGQGLLKNTLPESTQEQIIPLFITFSDYNSFDLNINLKDYEYGEVVLEDKYLNVSTGLDLNDEINYSVITDNTEESKASDRFALKVTANPLSIFNSQDKQSQFKIYPNPATETVQYEINWSYSNFDFKITDLLGNTVYNKKYSNSNSSASGNIDVSNLKKGIYNVTITSGKNVETEKLIIK